MPTALKEVIDKSTFDYIIAGGGTAGLTLAARLSEDPQASVLVLEYGGANIDDPAILRPASYGTHFGNDAYAWNHETVGQKFAGGSPASWARGKGLGGSSAINFMVWSKPPSEEIDDFEKLGNPGWNWDRYEKALQKTEGFIPPPLEIQKTNSLNFDAWKIGTTGPLTLTYPANINSVELKIQQTFVNRGIPRALNPLSGNPKGAFLTANNYDPKTHTRTYSTTAFYLPNKDRPNLFVLVAAHVHRIISEASTGGLKATGVEFAHDGKKYIVHARKEVVLSAGALKSPQILELSGIGNKDVLRAAQVPLKLEVPGVGKNVQEHFFVGLGWELREDVDFETLDLLRDPDVAAKHIALHASGSGIFTMGIIGFVFTTLEMFTPKAGEIYEKTKEAITKKLANLPPGLKEQYEIQLERLKTAPGCEFITIPGNLSQPNPPENGKRYVSILAAGNQLFGRGTIHSKNNDPNVDPEFDPHYFEEDVDLQILVEMVKFARGLADVSPFKDIITKELNPGPSVQTDEEIRAWITKYYSSTWHTIGSCSMLPKDKGGVVDPNLKVYGTQNIRVADLSIAPLHFSAHSQATAFAIAEQVADIIKGTPA